MSKRDTESHLSREFVRTSYLLPMCVLFAKGAVIDFSSCVVSVYLVFISLYP